MEYKNLKVRKVSKPTPKELGQPVKEDIEVYVLGNYYVTEYPEYIKIFSFRAGVGDELPPETAVYFKKLEDYKEIDFKDLVIAYVLNEAKTSGKREIVKIIEEVVV